MTIQQWPKKIAQAPIWLYRMVLSPYMPKSCRYHPSCSKYTHLAIEQHGALKGMVLGFLRILRCHPFSSHSFDDPVPSAFTWGSLLRYKRRNTKDN